MQRIGTPRPKLEMRDLELVLAVAASGSTVKASALLHLTQSAVSRGLLVAEERAGVRLFERSARGLQPTPAGEQMIRGATPILAQLAALERQMTSPAPDGVRLRVASECYTAYRWLPSTVASLRKTVPGVEVSLSPEHTADPVAALVAGDLDVALLTTSRAPAPLVSEPLFADEVVFLVAAEHPLAEKESLTRRDLSSYPLIVSSQTPPGEQLWFVSRVFGKRLPEIPPLRFPLTEAMVDTARAGMGIAVMSEWVAGPYSVHGDVVRKRWGGRPLARPWSLAFRREVADAARCLGAALARGVPMPSRASGGAP